MLIRNSEKAASGGILEISEPIVEDAVVVDLRTMRVIPTYTCGHCTDVVQMNPQRVRERTRCKKCMRLICERKQLCQMDCTPMYAMSQDRFEGAGKHSRLVPAIMAGCSTESEAAQLGLIEV